ncbi:MAG TPA: hypothetical protein DIS76_00310 [Rhodospirillaceae bacterium]|nr:hypothetical protein [Rhodospirillaceae bacterium]
MLHSLQLLLPALIPSWRFFDVISPSPRIEFILLKSVQDAGDQWHQLRPNPARLSFTTMLHRLLWNPDWNESLFLVSCAERMIENPTKDTEQEILDRIKFDLKKNGSQVRKINYLQFRLVFISRDRDGLRKEILFTSAIHPCAEDAVS